MRRPATLHLDPEPRTLEPAEHGRGIGIHPIGLGEQIEVFRIAVVEVGARERRAAGEGQLLVLAGDCKDAIL